MKSCIVGFKVEDRVSILGKSPLKDEIGAFIGGEGEPLGCGGGGGVARYFVDHRR